MVRRLDTTGRAYICLASSTLNFRARKKRSCGLISATPGPMNRLTYQGQGIEVLGVAGLLQQGP